MVKNRTTFLIGAGTPLNLELPNGAIKPLTKNITNEICKPYTDYLNLNNPITFVQEIYDELIKKYPPDPNLIAQGITTPSVNFEHLFHVLEMLYSYDMVWQNKCHNTARFPVFAPFTQPDITFDYDNNIISSVMDQFILRIMDIINEYDTVFREKKDSRNEWYRDFYQQFGANSDFFVFNYDTTIEESIRVYEDGFEPDNIQSQFKRFNPKRLLENPREISTINHLHGCINYYFSSYEDANEDIYTFLDYDLYKYPDYTTVKQKLVGRSRSQPASQSGETYYASPIVTGLRKPDKLNCTPFDFYHANLANRIIRNPGLVIAGYSFGDLYCNNLLERIHHLQEDRRRIVLIDFWNIPKANQAHRENILSQNMGRFLCRAAKCGEFREVMDQLYKNKTQTGALYSDNGCLMVLPEGFKHAASCRHDIEDFLNS